MNYKVVITALCALGCSCASSAPAAAPPRVAGATSRPPAVTLVPVPTKAPTEGRPVTGTLTDPGTSVIVVRVVDGQTVDTRVNATSPVQRIHLLGIVACEGSGAVLEKLVFEHGTDALLFHSHASKDHYVEARDGTDLGLAMIEAGQAIALHNGHLRQDEYAYADARSPDEC